MSGNSSKGFTLVEIMTVVLVMGILLALAVPNIMKYRETSRARACQVNLKTILAAVEEARLERDTQVLNAIKEDGSVDHLYGKFLRQPPTDDQKLKCLSGGEYSIEYDDNADAYIVTCSIGDKHAIDQY